MAFEVKVCGLTEAVRVVQAIDAGAAFIGMIFFPPSPRFVEPEAAGELAALVRPRARVVGVVVDPSDADLDHLLARVPLDMLQLHGHETPERVRTIAARFNLPVMKALRVEAAEDLDGMPAYAEVADRLLFDAKPPRDAGWPGGHGLPFDWRLLQGLAPGVRWGLAGGLTVDNLAAAVDLVAPDLVDVSSGVERSPGIKDENKLAAFMREAKRLGEQPDGR